MSVSYSRQPLPSSPPRLKSRFTGCPELSQELTPLKSSVNTSQRKENAVHLQNDRYRRQTGGFPGIHNGQFSEENNDREANLDGGCYRDVLGRPGRGNRGIFGECKRELHVLRVLLPGNGVCWRGLLP